MSQFHILVIEDEFHIAEGIKLHLQLKNYQVTLARDGVEGLEKWDQVNPDLIILDIMMPKMDGHKVLSLIRQKDEKLPVLILSAKDGVKDKIKAFSQGVDDYLSKPFDADELHLRIERLLVKSSWFLQNQKENNDQPEQVDSHFEFADFKVDLRSGQVESESKSEGKSSERKQFQLTEQELKLFQIFVRHQGIPMARTDLLTMAWGYTDDTETRTLDNFIVRFRRYFEVDSKRPRFFKSVRSIGYVFDPRD